VGRRTGNGRSQRDGKPKEQATTTATANPYRMTTKEQATTTTTADPYGMTNQKNRQRQQQRQQQQQ
jgi:hypothetical protein